MPALAAETVARLLAAEPAGQPAPTRILSHPGGRDVLDASEAALLSRVLDASRLVLREHGNMSSPSVLFALADALRLGPLAPGEDWWLVAFGAGFATHSCRVQADA